MNSALQTPKGIQAGLFALCSMRQGNKRDLSAFLLGFFKLYYASYMKKRFQRFWKKHWEIIIAAMSALIFAKYILVRLLA
ncbi:MAG: hypothetical protein J7J91_11115 [Deltaproteobacteria bacterium]|nr:hypothetical protein [Deltaproteobacteria bacterium]